MDAEGFQNSEYLRRHYAGLAMNGLLAANQLKSSLDANYGVSDGVKKFAALAFDVADAMVDETMKRSQE